MSELKYRPDIDGLRGVAVTLVLLFHGHVAFPGGFVGVDVFFVISGYLITALILRHHDANTYSLSGFWKRRIRRIIPASLAMGFTALIAGFLLLFPADYKELASSELSHQLMISNLFFWRNTGYFSGTADTKPLLHTWSLSVEEQFYLFYPAILAFMLRSMSRKKLVAALVASIAASLVMSEVGVRVRPVVTFYVLPTRAWELLLGGLVCFAPNVTLVRRAYIECMSVIAILLIVLPAIIYDSNTSFPGFNAIPPVAGAALLIYANSAQLTWIGTLLATKSLVFIGLISYSLYLWHWPMFAFTRYWLGVDLPAEITALVLAASFVLGCVSWRFVEKPFRTGLSIGREKYVVGGILLTIPIAIAGCLAVIGAEGFPGRISNEVHRYQAAQKNFHFLRSVTTSDVQRGDIPIFGDPGGQRKCLVWGDSHAMALVPGVENACRSSGIVGYHAGHSITAPLLEFVYTAERNGLGKNAPEFNQSVLEFAMREKIDIVILAGLWSAYATVADFEEKINLTINQLCASRIQVIVVLDVAYDDRLSPRVLAREAFFGMERSTNTVHIEDYNEKNQRCNDIIGRACEGKALIINPAAVFVTPDGIWQSEIAGEIMYFDNNHLSSVGSLRLGSVFADAFAELRAE